MMQLPCPYCGVRDEDEFRFGGQSHITRPDLNCSDAEWADYLFNRENPKGGALRTLAARVRLRSLVQPRSAHGHARDSGVLPHGRAEAERRRGCGMNGSQAYRLEVGGLIERDRPLTFTCNGQRFTGYAGDTLASALLANGVRVVGRSFKYHRPRGILAAGVEETNALFRIDSGVLSVPLVRATMQPLVEGLSATTENAWPSIGFDCGRVLDFTHWFWPAGFYNKTFKWPSWHWYEGLIRRSAGSGRLPTGQDASEYFQHNLHCDVLVVGGGPAGLREALAASREGARVVIAELEPRLGGSLRYERSEMDGIPPLQWLERAVGELGHAADVRVLTSTLVTGYYDHDVLVAVDRSQADDPTRPVERLWKIRAKRVVIATGAIEQPLVFANNDRPGIMLAGAVRRYLVEYAVGVGRAVVVATNNDDAYRTAFALHAAGIRVPAIVDAAGGAHARS